LIETERLLLRRVHSADVDDLVNLYADGQVRRFISTAAAYDRAEAMARVAADAEDWTTGRRTLVACERATGRFLGRIAIVDWTQFGETEVGWVFSAHGRGRGYATEGARAAQEWAFEQLEIPYVIALIRPDNERSIAVAERLGMAPIREDELFGVAVIVYSISREAVIRTM
jgi:RimJ/RimL family protein N-acetyltransferase